MDVDKLSQLRHINKEIEIIREQIRNIDVNMTTDSVRGSSPAFPYTMHNIKIKGIDIEEYNTKVKRLKIKLSDRIKKLIDATEEAYSFIGNIEDSEMRQILTLRYINNLTWQQIAFKMGTCGDGSTERKKHDRFMNVSRSSRKKVV